jgi:hypothetical protein
LLQVCRSGIENPDSSMGCYAMQPSDYDRFKPFFSKVLADYHNVAADAKHINNWNLVKVPGLPEDGVLDLTKLGLGALSMRVRVGRNLAEFPLPGAMTKEDRILLEQKMCQAFEQLQAMPEYGGGYHSLTEGHANFIDQAAYQKLVDEHVMFKNMANDSYLVTAGIARDWPFGRGCYVSADRGFIIWVGEEDHLRIMCMQTGTVLNEVFDRLRKALDVINNILTFATSPDYGCVTSCPTNLGTGMRASVHIKLPKLTAGGSDAKVCVVGSFCQPVLTFILFGCFWPSTGGGCSGQGGLQAAGTQRAWSWRRTHAHWRGRHLRHFAERPLLHHRGANYHQPLQRLSSSRPPKTSCDQIQLSDPQSVQRQRM